MFVLERKTVPAQLMLLISQFEPVNPIAFSKRFSRRYLTEEIRNLELVRHWALKKVLGSEVVPLKLRAQILDFLEPVPFNFDNIRFGAGWAVCEGQSKDPNSKSQLLYSIVPFFLYYLAQDFIFEIIPTKIRTLIIRDSNPGPERSLYLMIRQYYSYLTMQVNFAQTLGFTAILADEQSIFYLFKLYLDRKLASNSTFIKFIQKLALNSKPSQFNQTSLDLNFYTHLRKKGKPVFHGHGLHIKIKKALHQGLLGLTGSELRAQLSSLICPGLIVVFLAKHIEAYRAVVFS